MRQVDNRDGNLVEDAANGIFEDSTYISYVVKPIGLDEDNPWIKRMDKLLESLNDLSPTLFEELLNIGSLGEQEVIMTSDEKQLISLSKQKNDFMKRAELLEKDSDLKTQALQIKQKVRQLF